MDFPPSNTSLQAPILKISIQENPHYNDVDDFIINFCLIVQNSEKTAFQTCNDLVMGVLCDDSLLLEKRLIRFYFLFHRCLQ